MTNRHPWKDTIMFERDRGTGCSRSSRLIISLLFIAKVRDDIMLIKRQLISFCDTAKAQRMEIEDYNSSCKTFYAVKTLNNLYSSCVSRLKPIDVKFMKMLHEKVNIVPVIGKADSLTKNEIAKLKKRVIYCIFMFDIAFEITDIAKSVLRCQLLDLPDLSVLGFVFKSSSIIQSIAANIFRPLSK